VSFIGTAQEKDLISSLEDSISKNIYSNPDKAILFLHRYVKLNEKSNNLQKIILANSALAAAHEVSNEIDSTLYYHYKNLSIVQKPIDIVNTKYSIARVLEQEERYKESLRLYHQILELADSNNLEEAKNNIKLSIEALKGKIGESNDNLELIKKDYVSRVNNKDLNLRFVRKTLIEAFIKNQNYEEALSLIDVGVNEANQDNDCEFIYYMNVLRSNIHIQRNELAIAFEDSKLALKCAVQLNNAFFLNEIKFREAEIAFLNSDFEKAIENLKFILDTKANKSTEQLTKYYRLTADTYKKIGNSVLSADFYDKYITEKEKLSESRFSNLQTLYNLNLNERASEFQDVLNQQKTKNEKQKKTKWHWIYLSIVLFVIVLTLVIYFKNKSNSDQKKFAELIKKIDDFEKRKADEKLLGVEKIEFTETEIGSEFVEIEPNFNDLDLDDDDKKDSTFIIDNEKVEAILIKIQKLEDKLYFLRQDCTLHNMAKKLRTNTSYLSKIINTHLDKSFSIYINELRINYAIIELKHNKRLRAYSVKGIAQEMGYKNADAFSRYFTSATGISPSVYIKKIKESEKN